MPIATFRLDYPILRETLSHSPDVTLTWVQSDLTEGGTHRLLVWVEPGDVDAFDDRLETDPTVTAFSRLAAFEDRDLYHFELTEAGHRESVYPLIVEEGIVLDQVTADRDGWQFRATFPDHDALERFMAFCSDRDVAVELERLYEERTTSAGYGLTERQRETLVTAVDAGYLDIPRSCSLADLGDRLGVSANATSERFRRGVRALVRNTVYADSDAGPDSDADSEPS